MVSGRVVQIKDVFGGCEGSCPGLGGARAAEQNTDKRGRALLEVRNLYESFKVGSRVTEALSDVSFSVMPSEIFGLVGESGSGKSTIGRIISGIYEPTGGEIIYDGEIIRMGRERIYGTIKGARKEAKKEINRLQTYMNSRKSDRDYLLECIRYVNEDLQNRLNYERERLSVARQVWQRWHRIPHPDIRMVFQDPSASLNPRMTVYEIVAEALYAIGVRDKGEVRARVCEALSSVGLPRSALGRYPHEFSGGQRQRIGIARAVITTPRLLIADEPVSALDVSVGAQVVNLICDLAESMSLSVLFIAHDLSLVRQICNRVGVMCRGRMVELAESEELFNNPLHPYTRALISAIPPPDPRAAKRIRRESYDSSDVPRGVLREACKGHFLLCDE